MNKRRRRSAKRERHTQRDIFTPIATRGAAFRSILQLEDRRLFEPVDTFPRALFHRSARLVPSINTNVKRSNHVPTGISFNVPEEVSLCVRRKQRREVLFAKRRTGKGARARRRRRGPFSSVSC